MTMLLPFHPQQGFEQCLLNESACRFPTQVRKAWLIVILKGVK